MTADTLVSRLEGVRANGQGKWIARCPSHADKSPSLSIAETDDGRVLVYCHAGCGALGVLGAVGLRWSDVMPERLGEFKPVRHPFSPMQALLTAANEITVAAFIAHELGYGQSSERLIAASGRLHAILTLINREPHEQLRKLRKVGA